MTLYDRCRLSPIMVLSVLISCRQSVSFLLNPTTKEVASSLRTSSLMLTEMDVLRRNQGFLMSPSKEERDYVKGLMMPISSTHDDVLKTLKYKEYDSDKDSEGFGAVLLHDGVVRIDNVLSTQTTQNMLRYANQLLKQSMDEIAFNDGIKFKLFGNVHMNKNRFDLLLPLEESDEVMACLSELLGDKSHVFHSLQAILGEDAELFELSVLISDPGSEAQPLHPDIIYQDTSPPILTCFVALQDVSPQMGPTLFMPGSVSLKYHDDLHNRHLDPYATGLVATSYNVLSTLSAGDCSIYDTMILHLGSSNTSNRRRCLFYFSFKNNNVFKEGCRTGSSIRPSLKDRHLTLHDLRDKLGFYRDKTVKL